MPVVDVLVKNVMRQITRLKDPRFSGRVVWYAVSELFAIGSTSAIGLCRECGIDPDEKMPESDLHFLYRTCAAEMDDETQGPSETCGKMWGRIEEAIDHYK